LPRTDLDINLGRFRTNILEYESSIN